jgi:hypothetical protein
LFPIGRLTEAAAGGSINIDSFIAVAIEPNIYSFWTRLDL